MKEIRKVNSFTPVEIPACFLLIFSGGGNCGNPRRRHRKRKAPVQQVDMLPIVTRGCLCELPRKMGLTTTQTNSRFRLSNQVQTFRRVTVADPDADKFAKNLTLARLKFPFPHMVSVTVQQRTTGGWQLFSQVGGADILFVRSFIHFMVSHGTALKHVSHNLFLRSKLRGCDS